jgi:hypothetical protein
VQLSKTTRQDSLSVGWGRIPWPTHYEARALAIRLQISVVFVRKATQSSVPHSWRLFLTIQGQWVILASCTETRTGYGLIGLGSIPYMEDFSLLHNVQTDSGADPASYPMPTGSPSSGVELQGPEADHSPPFNAEVKNVGAKPPVPRISSWHNT